MPQTSIRRAAIAAAEPADVALLPRVARARRRIGERFYDRPEIRRTLASLILRRVLGGTHTRRADRPESP